MTAASFAASAAPVWFRPQIRRQKSLLNQEYATQKVPIITLRVILLVVGALLVLAGLVLAFISVFAVTNTYRSLIIILVLLALMLLSGIGLCIFSNIYTKKKLDKIGDQFYERYLECLSDKSVTSLQINV